MRLWVKPDQLAKLGITVPEIIGAIQKQNNVNPAGQIGSKPMEKRQNFTFTVHAPGPAKHAGGVWQHCHSGKLQRLIRASKGCGADRARCADV